MMPLFTLPAPARRSLQHEASEPVSLHDRGGRRRASTLVLPMLAALACCYRIVGLNRYEVIGNQNMQDLIVA